MTDFTIGASASIQLFAYGQDASGVVANVSNLTYSAEPASAVTLTANAQGVLVQGLGKAGAVTIHGGAQNDAGTPLSASSAGVLTQPVPLAVRLVLSTNPPA